MPWYRSGFLIKPTGNGTQNVNGVTPSTPQCVRFYSVDDTTDSVNFTGSVLCMGAMTATSQFSINQWHRDAGTDAVCNRRSSNTNCLTLWSGGSILAISAIASFLSMNVTGFSITWSSVSTTAASRVYWEAWGEYEELEIKEISSVNGLGDYTGLGFQSDLLLLHTAGSTAAQLNTTLASVTFGIGAATRVGEQFAVGIGDVDGGNTMVTDRSQVSNRICKIPFDSTVWLDGELTEINDDGFKINWNNNPSKIVWVICFKGGQHRVLQETARTTIGTQAYSGWNVGPIAGVSFFTTNLTANNDVTGNAYISVGGARNGGTQGGFSANSRDTPSVGDSSSRYEEADIYVWNQTPDIGNGVLIQADISSWQNNGATFNFTTVNGAVLMTLVVYGSENKTGGNSGGRGGGGNGVGGGVGGGRDNNRGNQGSSPGGPGGFDRILVASKRRKRLGVL